MIDLNFGIILILFKLIKVFQILNLEIQDIYQVYLVYLIIIQCFVLNMKKIFYVILVRN
jgi:hypothetical protein